MHAIITLSSIVTTTAVLISLVNIICTAYDETEIHGYHFHTYFFQDNSQVTEEALALR